MIGLKKSNQDLGILGSAQIGCVNVFFLCKVDVLSPQLWWLEVNRNIINSYSIKP